jgi:hypothetical protein
VFARFLLPYLVVNVPWSLLLTSPPVVLRGSQRKKVFSPCPARQPLLNKTARTFLPSRVPLASSLCRSYAYAVRVPSVSRVIKRFPCCLSLFFFVRYANLTRACRACQAWSRLNA